MKNNLKMIVIRILVCTICIWMVGCGIGNKEDGDKKMISENFDRFTLVYYEDDGASTRITIKLDKEQKEKVVITTEKKKEITSYKKCEELREFVKTRIIDGVEDSKTNTELNSDEQEIVWSIAIRSGEEYLNLDSLGGDEDNVYPEYWEDLLEVLGEK